MAPLDSSLAPVDPRKVASASWQHHGVETEPRVVYLVELMQVESARTSVIAVSLPTGATERFVRLWTESLAFTGIAVFIALGWGIDQAGSLSIFLVAASLLPRFQQLIRENMNIAVEPGEGGLRANTQTTAGALALFLGVFVAYAVVTMLEGPTGMPRLFGFALDLVHVTPQRLPGRRFDTQNALLVHEFTQLISFFGLAFIYRAYAVTLAIAFSGCVWGSALVMAIAHPGYGSGALRAPTEPLAGAFAVIPTGFLESLGLLLSAASAVVISRALFKYRLQDPKLADVLRSGLALFATGGLVHLMAVLYEWHVARALFRG